jgi:hypothetical protein
MNKRLWQTGCTVALMCLGLGREATAAPILYSVSGTFGTDTSALIDVTGSIGIEAVPTVTVDASPAVTETRILYSITGFQLSGSGFSFAGAQGDLLILGYAFSSGASSLAPERWYLSGSGNVSGVGGLFESPLFLSADGTPLPWSFESYSHLAPRIELTGGASPSFTGALHLVQVPEVPSVLYFGVGLLLLFGLRLVYVSFH